MKDAEDEAFDELAKRQGHWGGGYHAKRQMAADKFCDANCVWTDHHPDCNMVADKLQEPVAWAIYDKRGGSKSLHWPENHSPDGDATKFDAVPLYTAPPQPAQESWREFASDYERGFIDGMQKQAQSSVDKAVNQMAQREWVGLTDEDADDLFVETQRHMIGAGSREFTRIFTRLINAKLKEQNND